MNTASDGTPEGSQPHRTGGRTGPGGGEDDASRRRAAAYLDRIEAHLSLAARTGPAAGTGDDMAEWLKAVFGPAAGR